MTTPNPSRAQDEWYEDQVNELVRDFTSVLFTPKSILKPKLVALIRESQTRLLNEIPDLMKPIIEDHMNRAFKDFDDRSGYWQHGEMRAVGVAADRATEQILEAITLVTNGDVEKQV